MIRIKLIYIESRHGKLCVKYTFLRYLHNEWKVLKNVSIQESIQSVIRLCIAKKYVESLQALLHSKTPKVIRL